MSRPKSVRIFGREVFFVAFDRNSYHKYRFRIKLQPFKYTNNRIFSAILFGIEYRINWTPGRPK